MQLTSDHEIFHSITRGIEKENLRVTKTGKISPSPHPQSLGHPLTHPYITTDYAESQLEIVTTPNHSIENLFSELKSIYEFVYNKIGDETLWPNSMPPAVAQNEKIQIANYGNNPEGQLKTLYRKGLSFRYGSVMQLISGIHYNFSLNKNYLEKKYQESGSQLKYEAYVDSAYFSLISNYLRHGWLLLYLFGASPLCEQSSIHKAVSYIKTHQKGYAYADFATSLRLSELGYQNKARELLQISFADLNSYIKTLQAAMELKHPEFIKIGLVDADGSKKQMNSNLLQIENEFYAPIRPKQPLKAGEHPTQALNNRGIKYLEIRVMDLNPLLPFGMSKEDAAFIELLLTFFLFQESTLMSECDYMQVLENFNLVATYGRDPELELTINHTRMKLTEIVKNVFAELEKFILQYDLPPEYVSGFKAQLAKVNDVRLLPSQQCIDLMAASGLTFTEFNMKLAEEHKQYFKELSAADNGRHETKATQSLMDFNVKEQPYKGV